MALNYTKIFGDLLAFVTESSSYNSIAATTLAGDLTTVLTQLGTVWAPAEGLAATYHGFQQNVASWRQTLAGYAARRLLDRDTVLNELALPAGTGLAAVLEALNRQLRVDSKTVNACATAVGSVSAAAGNAGNGSAWPTLVLDGYSPPGSNMAASTLYQGSTSELVVGETHSLVCVTDQGNGAQAGGEYFQWSGAPFLGTWHWGAEGSGLGPLVQVANADSTIRGKDFETFSSNVPDGFTLTTGTAGTHCAQDVATPFRGSGALKLTGTGTASVLLEQSVSPSLVNARRRYHFGCAVKKFSGTPASSEKLRVKFSGTGYSPASAETLEIDGDDWPASWTLYNAHLNVPSVVPSDLKLRIELVNVASGSAVLVDSFTFCPVTYFGGLGVAVVAGAANWVRGDRLTFATTNDAAGNYQSFFRRAFGVQLPSAGTGNISPAG